MLTNLLDMAQVALLQLCLASYDDLQINVLHQYHFRHSDTCTGNSAAPAVPAALVSLVAAMPAHAAGAGAEIARPSTSAVQSAIERAPTLLESTSIDQAVNSVVDVVKVAQDGTSLCIAKIHKAPSPDDL